MDVPFVLALLLVHTSASSPYIIGLCNSYTSPITIISRYDPTLSCQASPGESCPINAHYPTYGAYLPELPTNPSSRQESWPEYRIAMHSADGEINYNLWSRFHIHQPDGTTLWGRAYGSSDVYDVKTGSTVPPQVNSPDIQIISDMDGYSSTYNVIVHPNKRITLYQANSAMDCPVDPRNCTFDNSVVNETVIGSWVPTHFSDEEEKITITQGVTHSTTISNSKSWSDQTTASMKAGFQIFGFSSSFTISHESGSSISETFSSTIEKSTTNAVQLTEPAGMIWQWQFNVTSNCGGSQVTTMAIMHTEDLNHPPCCLPGYFTDPKDPHSKCLKDKGGHLYDLCKGPRGSPNLPLVVV